MTVLVPSEYCPDESDNAKIQSVLQAMPRTIPRKRDPNDCETASIDGDLDEDLSDPEELDEWVIDSTSGQHSTGQQSTGQPNQMLCSRV